MTDRNCTETKEGVEEVNPPPMLKFAVTAAPARHSVDDAGDKEEDSSTVRQDEEEYDPHYDPIVSLPLVETKTCEEEEGVLWSERSKLYRFTELEDGTSEWKERGTGTMKILMHRLHQRVRLVMRRDQTFKVCANHYILPEMELRNHLQSDRTWLWNTPADVSDEEPKPCLFAAKFRTQEIACDFRKHFNEGKSLMMAEKSLSEGEETGSEEEESHGDPGADEISEKLKDIKLKPASESDQ